MKSKTIIFQRFDYSLKITYQNHTFTESQNGPYGPWEPFLQWGLEHLGCKHLVKKENWQCRVVEKVKHQAWDPKSDFWKLFWDEDDIQTCPKGSRPYSGSNCT